jgi:hypothetical protein
VFISGEICLFVQSNSAKKEPIIGSFETLTNQKIFSLHSAAA